MKKFHIDYSDLLRAILIISAILGLTVVNVLSRGLKYIKDRWPEYRCNPIIMPLAGQFGYDVGDNFSYCVQDIMTVGLKDILQPLNYIFETVGEALGGIINNITAIKDFIANLRNFLNMLTGGIMGIFLNILLNFQVVMFNIQDLMAKSAGIFGSSMHMMGGSQLTMESSWNGPPGQIARALCFHPKTKIIANNNIKSIAKVKEGDVLKNNKRVIAIMRINNLDDNNNIQEKLYEIPDGENNEKILVSGSHLIFDKKINNFVKTENYKNATLSNISSKKLICLITTDHTIPIGDKIFHDWEDNQGSKSKS